MQARIRLECKFLNRKGEEEEDKEEQKVIDRDSCCHLSQFIRSFIISYKVLYHLLCIINILCYIIV